jgi:multidrug efflux system outer membrane protein
VYGTACISCTRAELRAERPVEGGNRIENPPATCSNFAPRPAGRVASERMKIFDLRHGLLVATAVLTGCASVGPDYAPPSGNAPATWHHVAATSQPATPVMATGDLSQWWQGFNDPLLTQLIAEALQASPDLRSAQARLREARARSGVARADYYPSLSASANASRNKSSAQVGSGGTRELYDAGFDASWEVDVFGGVRRSVEASQAEVAAAVAGLEDTQVSLAAEVATNYVDVRALQARLRIARDNLASQSETLQLTDWRAQAGLVSVQDVEQARSNREQTRAQIPILEAGIAAAVHNLDVLLGLNPGTLHPRLDPEAGLPTLPAEIAVGIPADTLRQRPDVRVAERQLAAATARVGEAKAAMYPSFRLSGSIGLEALTAGALGDSGATFSSLLGGITAPIFEGGRLRSQVEVQDAVREQAQVTYEQAVLGALRDVENALVDLSHNRDRSEALSNALDAARLANLLAQRRYAAGLIDFQTVLDTDRSVLTLEDSLAGTRADVVRDVIRLYKSLGGGWSPTAASAVPAKGSP